MEPIEESREPQRLYAPSRLTLRGAGERPDAVSRPDPERPWTSDHRWRPEGQAPDGERSVTGVWLGRALAFAVIVLANAGLLSPSAAVHAVVVVLDACAIVILLDALVGVLHLRRRGVLRMRWKTFPVFVGGRLEGVLVARPALEPLAAVRTVLRCVRDERVVRPLQSGGEEVSFEPVVLYQQISEAPVPMDEMKMKELRLSFDVPADLPGTDLGRDEAVYWQVALRIPTMGPDLEKVFLAPVYAQPRPPEGGIGSRSE
jgi:hypothetical protein